MLLFLDVISPLPEFLLIEDNKVILQRKIINKESDKLSDNIFEIYMQINNHYNLDQKLKKISITIGPGSYTSLRVGASFVAGLTISKKLLFYSFSIDDIFKFELNNQNINNAGIYINSANNQNFMCILDNKNKIHYYKLEDDNFVLPENINTILYNEKKLDLSDKNIEQFKFSFAENLFQNYKRLDFSLNQIVKPIYISNNKILN
tara:strand:+ start:748 stop:1362 length:615 start_codon:yes stop_codon:yes gene_type:complete